MKRKKLEMVVFFIFFKSRETRRGSFVIGTAFFHLIISASVPFIFKPPVRPFTQAFAQTKIPGSPSVCTKSIKLPPLYAKTCLNLSLSPSFKKRKKLLQFIFYFHPLLLTSRRYNIQLTNRYLTMVIWKNKILSSIITCDF